jgi:hypothetical protein
MEAEIKCLECGRITRHFELGQIFYDVEKSLSSVVVKESIVCPKCKADISQRKCAVKTSYFFGGIIAANIFSTDNEFLPLPRHLQGVFPLRKSDYLAIAPHCRARLKVVDMF